MVVNIICAYAPRVVCIENEKETFWEQMDQELSARTIDIYLWQERMVKA